LFTSQTATHSNKGNDGNANGRLAGGRSILTCVLRY